MIHYFLVLAMLGGLLLADDTVDPWHLPVAVAALACHLGWFAVEYAAIVGHARRLAGPGVGLVGVAGGQ